MSKIIEFNKKEQLNEDKNNNKYTYDYCLELFEKNSKSEITLEKIYAEIQENVREDWIIEFILRRQNLLNNFNNNPQKYLNRKVSLNGLLDNFVLSVKTKLLLKNIEERKKEAEIYVGTGFIYIENEFYYSEIIKDYFAKMFIEKVFEGIKFDDFLIQNYSSFDDFELKEGGCIKYIISDIEKVDGVLASYVINHQYLLDEILLALNFVKKNWDNYFFDIKIRNLEEMGAEIFNYMDNQNYDEISMNRLWSIAYYVANELDFLDQFYKYTIGHSPNAVKEIKKLCKKWKYSKEYEETIYYSEIKAIMQSYLYEENRENNAKPFIKSLNSIPTKDDK